jgi:hypothetical protein
MSPDRLERRAQALDLSHDLGPVLQPQPRVERQAVLVICLQRRVRTRLEVPPRLRRRRGMGTVAAR